MVTLSSLVPVLTQQPYPPGKPKGWLPLYTMVTFRPDINYATVKAKALRQSVILTRAIWIGVIVFGATMGWATWSTRNTFLDYYSQYIR